MNTVQLKQGDVYNLTTRSLDSIPTTDSKRTRGSIDDNDLRALLALMKLDRLSAA